MPRPPLLPAIDWRSIYEQSLTWSDWLEAAEMPEHREKMEQLFAELDPAPQQIGYLQALARPVHGVAIAEDWCGDVVRHAPVLARLAELSQDRVRVRFIRRDTSLELFARFLTNGGESIPKFVFLSEDFVECGQWGPMPADCRAWIARGKAANNVGSARERVSALYAADPKCRIVIRELLDLIDIAATASL